MFWSKAKFYKAECERLRAENRELLICILEASGRREAANMMRGPQPETPKVDAKKPVKEPESRIGWRWIQKQAMSLTRPDTTSKDSVEQLENRVKEVTQ